MSEPLDPEVFRETMGRFTTGVTVVTTATPHGMTANAVASVSLDPLLVLVCVDRTAAMADQLPRAAVFGVSMLAADQEDLSWRFADPDREFGASEFDGVEVAHGVTGVPLLVGALATLECEVEEVHPGGDHVIVVGRVLAAEVGRDAPPLTWFRSTYGTLDPPEHVGTGVGS